MALKYGPENVPVSDLPETLFPQGVCIPLAQYSPAELEALAARPQTIKEMPADWSESKKRQMRGLAQYGGRSAAGNKRSLSNLPRKLKMDNLDPVNLVASPTAPTVPEGAKLPADVQIPTMIPKVPVRHTILGKYLRRVLSQEEARLYEETYIEWMTAHPEYDMPEDRDDLMTICMETVKMFRFEAIERQNPKTDTSEKYNQAARRKQQARENLMARRRDRNDPKNKKPGGFNVAAMAGEFSPEKIAAKQLESKVQAAAEEDDFLTGTVVKAKTVESTENA